MTPFVVSTSDGGGDGKEEGMKDGQAIHDRRRAARASARRRIMILGDGHGRATIVDLSSTSDCRKRMPPLGSYRLDDRVDLADTVPARIANDLRGYVRMEHRDLVLVRMKEQSQ
jgi:hypothetical protein